MRSRLARWRDVARCPRVIFDRSVDEDARVFCRMHHELGLLDHKEYRRLRALARDLQRSMPQPELIIFVSPDRRALARRVMQPGHPALIVRSLDRQLSLYSEWLATRHENVLRLDNSSCALRTVQRFFAKDFPC